MLWNSSFVLAYRTARKFAIAVMGVTVVLFGIMLIFTPGPALVVIPLGLMILGVEFAWARRWLAYLKERGQSIKNRMQQNYKRQTKG